VDPAQEKREGDDVLGSGTAKNEKEVMLWKGRGEDTELTSKRKKAHQNMIKMIEQENKGQGKGGQVKSMVFELEELEGKHKEDLEMDEIIFDKLQKDCFKSLVE
jgi:hypothetical protein